MTEKPDYAEIEQALRKNGLAVLRKGNRNKLEMGRDGKTLVIYGTLLYSPSRDKGYVSDSKLVNHIVEKVKAKAKQNQEIESTAGTNHSPGKSHHKPGEKYEHHKKSSFLQKGY
jgi:hypothetical protein